MQIKANGIDFHCQIDGPEGAPWLMFSNSLATNLSMWDAQVAQLKSAFRILRYDHRGHGQTQAPAGPYTFATLIADVVALLDALSIPKTHFLGLSMGGMTAMGLAENHRDRVAKLVVCDCTGSSSPASAEQWAVRIALAKDKGMEALVEPTVSRWFPPDFFATHPELAEKVRAMVRNTPVNGFMGCAAALSDFNVLDRLTEIRNPTLFVCGTKDAALPGLKKLHATLPGSGLAELEGAGHLSNLDAPEAFTQAIEGFLKV